MENSKIDITSKIIKVATKKVEEGKVEEHTILSSINENIKRPHILTGTTYQLKTPLSKHALYITINSIVMNEDTEYESLHPFEIFINGKDMEHFQYTVALTRLLSAVFRKGGDIVFVTKELMSIYDPNGGYLSKGGKYIPSLVAEIGSIIEKHFIKIGILKIEDRKELLDSSKITETNKVIGSLCAECNHMSVVRIDGCEMCRNCGASKCG